MKAKDDLKKTASADWHRADIIAALRKKGLSLRQLALAYGYHGATLNAALSRDWPKAERIIADALGVSPDSIWPSRYLRRNYTPRLVINPSLRSGAGRFAERRAA